MGNGKKKGINSCDLRLDGNAHALLQRRGTGVAGCIVHVEADVVADVVWEKDVEVLRGGLKVNMLANGILSKTVQQLVASSLLLSIRQVVGILYRRTRDKKGYGIENEGRWAVRKGS